MASTTLTTVTTSKSSILLHGQPSSQLSPTPDTCTTQLTFGLELECIFAFHESLLLATLANHSTSPVQIVKNIPAAQEPLLRRARLDAPYRSWALASPVSTSSLGPRSYQQDGVAIRAYDDEPLQLVRSLAVGAFGSQQVNVHASTDKVEDYSGWNLQNDSSLAGFGPSKLPFVFPDRITEASSAEWDSWGVELVSPPCVVGQSPATLHSITDFIHTLKGDASSTHGAAVDDNCGLHVHIGHPDSSPFALSTLQHLAYLLVLYEDVLTSLHPASRRHIFAGDDTRRCFIASLRSRWMLDCPEPFVPRPHPASGCASPVCAFGLRREDASVSAQPSPVCALGPRREGDTSSSPLEAFGLAPVQGQLSPVCVCGPRRESDKEWETQYASVEAIRGQIFSTKTVPELVQLLQDDRFHVVNFAGLVESGRPNTVEFRQHAGTLDPEAVRRWVGLCARFVETAERRARSGPWEGACANVDWDDVSRLRFEDLSELMRLDWEAHAYWSGRVEEFGVFTNELLVMEAPEPFDDDFGMDDLE